MIDGFLYHNCALLNELVVEESDFRNETSDIPYIIY